MRFKIIIVIFIFLFLHNTKIYAAEQSLEDLQKELDKVTEEFQALETSNLPEAIIFDSSIEEINKAVEFVQQSLENENPDLALKTVTFVNKSLSDISAILPKNYDSDMSNADMSSLGEDTLKEVTNVTDGLAIKKEEDTAKLINTMLDVNDAGFNLFNISKNLNSFGVDTIKVQLDLKTREEMSAWTKEEWENAWTGGVLTDDGEQIVTDDEVENKLLELNSKIESIKETDARRVDVQNNIDTLNNQLTELENQKTTTINQIETNKLSLEKQIELTKREIATETNILNVYNEKIENLDKQIENINALSLSVQKEKNSIISLKEETTKLSLDTNNLSDKLKESNDKLTNLEQSVVTRSIVTRDMNTRYKSWENNTITYDNRKLFDSTLEKIATSDSLSIDFDSISDENRIEYYDQYKEIFDAEKRWTNTSFKKNNTDNLKLDGTASGFIERQKKVLFYKKEYEVWNTSISYTQDLANEERVVVQKLNLEIENINNKVNSTNQIISTKETNLGLLQENINQFNLNDERYGKIADLESEKKLIISNIEQQNTQLKKNLEDENKKLIENFSSISSLQAGQIEIDNKLQLLNEKIFILTEKKDLTTVKSRTDIQKEVDAFNNFGHILANSAENEKIADIEIEYALNQADVILSGDSKRHQVFDLEKYGKIAGLSANLINQGKSAINNEDWNTQKQVYSELFTSLSKNKNYNVNVLSDSELNNLIVDQKFENEIIDLVRSNPTNINFEPAFNTVYWAKGAIAPQSLTKTVEAAYNQILDNTNYSEKLTELNKLKTDFTEGMEWLNQANVSMANLNNKITKLTSEGKLNEANSLRNMLNKDLSSKFSKKYTGVLKAQSEMGPASMAVSKIQSDAKKQANTQIMELNDQIRETQKDAVNNLNKMIDDKLSTMASYDQNKISKIKSMISQISPDSPYLVINPSSELFAAKAKAILYDDDGKMLKAFNIANDTSLKSVLYDTSGTGKIRNLKNFTSDRTNVELAAEIQSTLNGTYSSESIDGYMTAKYHQGSTIEEITKFTSNERKEVAKELNIFFSNKKDSSLIKNLDNEINSLKEEINSTESLKDNISNEIANLEKEIEKINSSTEKIQVEITNIGLEVKKNEELFKAKELKISNTLEEINPINFAIDKLASAKNSIQMQIEKKTIELNQKKEFNGKIDTDLQLVLSELKTKENAFDLEINPLKTQQTQLIAEVQILTDEVNEFNKNRPEFDKQITKLEEEITILKNTKADLATAQAKNIGLKVDENTIKSINVDENTAIIALNGPALVRVVDQSMLIEQSDVFIDPISEFSVNSKIYTSAAIRPEELFAVKNITGEITVALSEGTVKEIGSGSLGIKIDKVEVESTQTASIDQNTTMTDATIEIAPEKMSTSSAMSAAKAEAVTANSDLKTVSTASTTLSSVSSKDMEISGDYSNNYGFNNKATAKAVVATKSAAKASSSARSAATASKAAAQSAQKTATAAAQAAETAATNAATASKAAAEAATAAAQTVATAAAQAAQAASRQAAEAAAMQAAQAASAVQAQQAALASATQATSAAANVAAQAAATNEAVATAGAAGQASKYSALETAQAAAVATSAALNVAEKAAAASATAANQAAAQKAYSVAIAARDIANAQQAAINATQNAVSMASVQARAAAAVAAKEAVAAAALAIQDVTNEAAQAAAAAASSAAVSSQISAINARVAELEGAMQSWNAAKDPNAETLNSQTNAEIESLKQQKEGLQ